MNFCRVYGCQNVLTPKSTDFCHDPHRALYHKNARLVGHGVITLAGYDEAMQFKKQCEHILKTEPRAQAHAREERIKIGIKKSRAPEIDLDRLRPQERLGLLCRSAERMGVLHHKRNA